MRRVAGGVWRVGMPSLGPNGVPAMLPDQAKGRTMARGGSRRFEAVAEHAGGFGRRPLGSSRFSTKRCVRPGEAVARLVCLRGTPFLAAASCSTQ